MEKRLSRLSETEEEELTNPRDLSHVKSLPLSFHQRLANERDDFGLPNDFGSAFSADEIMRTLGAGCRESSPRSLRPSVRRAPSSIGGDSLISDAVIEKVVAVPVQFYRMATASRGSLMELGDAKRKSLMDMKVAGSQSTSKLPLTNGI